MLLFATECVEPCKGDQQFERRKLLNIISVWLFSQSAFLLFSIGLARSLKGLHRGHFELSQSGFFSRLVKCSEGIKCNVFNVLDFT